MRTRRLLRSGPARWPGLDGQEDCCPRCGKMMMRPSRVVMKMRLALSVPLVAGGLAIVGQSHADELTAGTLFVTAAAQQRSYDQLSEADIRPTSRGEGGGRLGLD